MKLRSVIIRLALFTALTGAVTIILASIIGNFAPFKARYSIEATFTDATGLLASDPVTLAGVRVGKVKSTRVDHGYAIAVLSIDRDVKLPRTTHIEIRYRNLLGLRVVNLDPGTGTAPYLNKGDRVPASQTEGPLDLDQIFNNLRPLLTGINGSDLNILSEALVRAIAPHKEDIDSILADTANFFGTLSGKDQQIGSLVESLGTVATSAAAERTNLETLLRNLADIAETLSDNAGRLDDVLTNLNTATGNLAEIVGNNRTNLERDIGNVAILLELVRKHQADLVQVVQNLDDVQLATLKAMSYGEWVNLYLPAFCIAGTPGCEAELVSTSAPQSARDVGSMYSGSTEGPR